MDCSGKVFLITGAGGAIGKSVAREIAKKAGVLHLVFHSQESAEVTRKEIVEEIGNPHVHVHVVDMSEPIAVHTFVQKFTQQTTVLDVLINNVGCVLHGREVNSVGIEKNFSTNVLGPFILTNKLLALMKMSQEPRVVMVLCGDLLLQRLNANDLQFKTMDPFESSTAHAQNMRRRLTIVEKLAVRYPHVHFCSANPGWVNTPALKETMPKIFDKMKDRLRSADEGADTIVWLAVSSAAVKHASGLYFQDRRPANTHLTMAWTRATVEEESKLMDDLESLSDEYQIVT